MEQREMKVENMAQTMNVYRDEEEATAARVALYRYNGVKYTRCVGSTSPVSPMMRIDWDKDTTRKASVWDGRNWMCATKVIDGAVSSRPEIYLTSRIGRKKGMWFLAYRWNNPCPDYAVVLSDIDAYIIFKWLGIEEE